MSTIKNKTCRAGVEMSGDFRASSYTEQVRRVIRDATMDGTYSPGQRLKEAEIAEALGVSRSPVREAIFGLSNEGPVKVLPQRGTFVCSLDIDEIKELYEVQEGIEVQVVRMAAKRAEPGELEEVAALLEQTRRALTGDSATYPRDFDFHLCLARLSKNLRLAKYTSEINVQLQLARTRSASSPERSRRAYEEHLAVFEGISEGDVEGAGRAMRHHLRQAVSSLVERLSTEEG